MPYNGSISEALSLVYPNIVTKASYSYFFSNTLPAYWGTTTCSSYSSSNTSFVPYNWTPSDAIAVPATTKAPVPGALDAFHNVAKVSFTTGTSTSSDIVITELSKRLYTYDASHALVEVAAATMPPALTGATTVQKQQASDVFILPGAHSSADWLAHAEQHELSHAIGLKDADGITSLSTSAKNNSFTIMSYNNHLGEGTYATELQLYDIAALQSIYGRADTYAATDTVYNSFAETTGSRVGHDRMFSIWDGGGNDTIDASSLTTAALIDLRPGHFSSIGPDSIVSITAPTSATGTPTVTNEGKLNVSIAFGAYIENATGTSSADLIIGDAYSNHLVGGGGNDVIYGEGYFSAYNPGDGDYSRVTNTGSKIVAASVDPNSQVDIIDGGDGNDFLVGSRGADTINGGDGNDIIIGNGGLNGLNGGAGDDIMYGYNPTQLEYGGVTFSGGTGNDTFYCSGGNNVILDLDNGDTVFVHGVQLHGGALVNVPASNQYGDGTFTYAWDPVNSTVTITSPSSYGVKIYNFQNGEAGIYLDNTHYYGSSSVAPQVADAYSDDIDTDSGSSTTAEPSVSRSAYAIARLAGHDAVAARKNWMLAEDFSALAADPQPSNSVSSLPDIAQAASRLVDAISVFDPSVSADFDLYDRKAPSEPWLFHGTSALEARQNMMIAA